jgi:serine/threonine protein kinase
MLQLSWKALLSCMHVTSADSLQVGSGGYSDVHRAQLRGQLVAAKVLRVGAATSKVLRSLQHEAYVMSLMSHPNITPFYGGHAAWQDGQRATGSCCCDLYCDGLYWRGRCSSCGDAIIAYCQQSMTI